MFDALLNFIWPPACPLCLREQQEDTGLCQSCGEVLPRRAVPLVDQDIPDGLDGLFAPFRYAPPIKPLLLTAKYGLQPYGLPALGALLAEGLPDLAGLAWPDCVVAVPSSRKHLRCRGFNPADDLATAVARTLEIPFAPWVLKRQGKYRPQAQLSGADRRRNLRGAFRARGVAGLSVLLVDDVATTGTTLFHCSVALRAAGARSVFGAVLCAVRSED